MSFSKKRRAPDAATATTEAAGNGEAIVGARGEKPLVGQAELKEMRRRIRSVVEEMIAQRLVSKDDPGGSVVREVTTATVETAAVDGGSTKGGGGGATRRPDPVTTAYLRAFLAAVAAKTQNLCELLDPKESQEEDELFRDVVQFCEDIRADRARLAATRARVARLSAATCSDALRVSQAAEERACAILEASLKHARKESETGGPLPLVTSAANGSGRGGGGGGDGNGSDEDSDGDADTGISASFSGIDAALIEPKVSRLIGKLSELPGPLKSVLQEMPELTASLAVSVQSAEAIMEARQSKTEALLGKAPPTPVPKKKKGRTSARGVGAEAGAAAAGEVDDERHPPAEVRSAAREARVEQARKEWEAGGVGVVGGMFS